MTLQQNLITKISRRHWRLRGWLSTLQHLLCQRNVSSSIISSAKRSSVRTTTSKILLEKIPGYDNVMFINYNFLTFNLLSKTTFWKLKCYGVDSLWKSNILIHRKNFYPGMEMFAFSFNIYCFKCSTTVINVLHLFS